MQEAYVKLEQVTKVYKMGEVEIRAVDGINFEVKKGEFVVIVGPSGAGKFPIRSPRPTSFNTVFESRGFLQI